MAPGYGEIIFRHDETRAPSRCGALRVNLPSDVGAVRCPGKKIEISMRWGNAYRGNHENERGGKEGITFLIIHMKYGNISTLSNSAQAAAGASQPSNLAAAPRHVTKSINLA